MSIDGVEGVCVGVRGKWQMKLSLLLTLPVMLTGLYGTNYVFLAADTKYRCLVPECEGNVTNGVAYTSSETEKWWQWALPVNDRCHRWQPVQDGDDLTCDYGSFDNSTLQSCDQIVYQSHSSIVSEFNLGCQEWKRSLVGTIHNAGMLVSLPAMGYVSDRWGRRAALIVSGCGVGVIGLIKSFVTTYHLYVITEFLEAVIGASVYPSAFVLLIEWLGVEQRILASLILGIPLSFGSAMLSLLDYMTGYWRLWARIAYPPSFLLLLYPWLLPESVRWLIARGKLLEAIKVIRQAARTNNVVVPEEAMEKILIKETAQMDEKDHTEEESLITAFFRYNVLRRRLCVCFFWWISAVFVFYGLAVRSHALTGSPHVNYVLLAAVELPALILNTLFLDRVGRKPLLTSAFLLTATALIAMTFIPDSASNFGIALYLFGKIGATMSLNALYVYTAELFPTRARHSLLAACSTMGRVGSILAPLTPLLAVYYWWLPTLLFGSLPLLSATLTTLVPDTLKSKLPDSFSDLQPRLKEDEIDAEA